MRTRGNPIRPTHTDPRPVCFTLPYLPAREVFLAGSFNGWDPRSIRLEESEPGWAVEFALSPGSHEYRFVVDGIWVADPNNPRTAPNPFGGRNPVVYIESNPPPPIRKRPSSKNFP